MSLRKIAKTRSRHLDEDAKNRIVAAAFRATISGVVPSFGEFFAWTFEEQAAWAAGRQLALKNPAPDGTSEIDELIKSAALSAAKNGGA